MAKYQVMPDLSPEEYEALKQDIAERGVQVPVEYDEDGNILDGHHRVRACMELGIKEWPTVVRIGMTEEEKLAHARRLNLARRHLTREQRRELIRQQLKETPEKSDRELSRVLGVDHKTIGSVRRELESIGEIPQCDRVTSDGRIYPKKRKNPEPKPEPITEPEPEPEPVLVPDLESSKPKPKPVAIFGTDQRNVKKLQSLDEEKRRAAVDLLVSNKAANINAAATAIKREERFKPQLAPEIVVDKNFVCGDAREVLKTLPDRSVSMVLTDPPYGMGFLSNWREYENEVNREIQSDMTIEEATDLLDQVLTTIKPKLADNAHIYVFTNWKVYPAMVETVARHFQVRNCLVWDKEVHGFGALDYWGPQHEWIIFATKGNRPLIGKRPVDVLRFKRIIGDNIIHPTQKPVALLKYLIEKSTYPGELVVDPFAGSGSTLKAAKETGRKYFGCELDKTWYQKGVEFLATS